MGAHNEHQTIKKVKEEMFYPHYIDCQFILYRLKWLNFMHTSEPMKFHFSNCIFILSSFQCHLKRIKLFVCAFSMSNLFHRKLLISLNSYNQLVLFRFFCSFSVQFFSFIGPHNSGREVAVELNKGSKKQRQSEPAAKIICKVKVSFTKATFTQLLYPRTSSGLSHNWNKKKKLKKKKN